MDKNANGDLTDDDPISASDVQGKASTGFSASTFTGIHLTLKGSGGAEVNPDAKAVNLLSVNINYRIPAARHVELRLYGQNLLDEEYHFTEFSKGWVNTLPIMSGAAVYGSLSVRL